jgi:hypothetical protein
LFEKFFQYFFVSPPLFLLFSSSLFPLFLSLSLSLYLSQVTKGKGSMPAWLGQLSPEEINAVASYVFEQATGDKW